MVFKSRSIILVIKDINEIVYNTLSIMNATASLRRSTLGTLYWFDDASVYSNIKLRSSWKLPGLTTSTVAGEMLPFLRKDSYTSFCLHREASSYRRKNKADY